MNFDAPTSSLPQALGGALRRLAQLTHTSSWDQWAAQRLTPTQRKILELLGSRSESLTLSAVAKELGVTAATACDSVGALETKGLVRKERNPLDGRALALLLTDEGRLSVTQLAALPDPLRGAFGALGDAEQDMLYRLAIKMIHGLQESGSLPASRMCVRCRFFDPFRYASSPNPHHCHRAAMPFANRQLRIDCAEFEAGNPAAQAALWDGLSGRRRTMSRWRRVRVWRRRASGLPGGCRFQETLRLDQVRAVDHLPVEAHDTRSGGGGE